jgi:hypothetical protein
VASSTGWSASGPSAPVSIRRNFVGFGLKTLAEAGGREDELVGGCCGYLASVADARGAVPILLPSVERYPRAEHWTNGRRDPWLDPTIGRASRCACGSPVQGWRLADQLGSPRSGGTPRVARPLDRRGAGDTTGVRPDRPLGTLVVARPSARGRCQTPQAERIPTGALSSVEGCSSETRGRPTSSRHACRSSSQPATGARRAPHASRPPPSTR